MSMTVRPKSARKSVWISVTSEISDKTECRRFCSRLRHMVGRGHVSDDLVAHRCLWCDRRAHNDGASLYRLAHHSRWQSRRPCLGFCLRSDMWWDFRVAIQLPCRKDRRRRGASRKKTDVSEPLFTSTCQKPGFGRLLQESVALWSR
jgi:hypothetical protein